MINWPTKKLGAVNLYYWRLTTISLHSQVCKDVVFLVGCKKLC